MNPRVNKQVLRGLLCIDLNIQIWILIKIIDTFFSYTAQTTIDMLASFHKLEIDAIQKQTSKSQQPYSRDKKIL